MNNLISLLLTIFVGLFILLGVAIVKIFKNNDRVINFSISAAIGVVFSLVIFELIPESIDLISEGYNNIITFLLVIGFGLFGIIILKIIDEFIPHHHCDEPRCQDKLNHLGFISSIGIILHNIIEGMVVYSSSLNSFSLGVLLCIGVGLHNIPLGMVISSTLTKDNKKATTLLVIFLITISSFLGGLIMFLLPGLFANEIFLGIILSITTGMLSYIVVFELIPEVKRIDYKKNTIIGIVTGLCLFFISLIFH